MANDVKAAGLEPITEEDVLELAGEVIAEHHTNLADARIRYFWLKNAKATVWGNTKALSELEWWLSQGGNALAAAEEGVDIVVRINSSLWGNLGRHGRRFILDHRLSLVQLKEGGQTEMETTAGTRYLYEMVKDSLGISPEVLARNPQGLQEIKELKKLHQALADPAQFMLDLQAEAANGDGDGDSEDEQEGGPGGGASDQPEPEPIYYYQTARLETGLRTGWLVYLQYDAPEKTPHHLTGVHFPEDQSPIVGGADPVDKSKLTFDQSVSAVRTYRNDLLADLEARRVAALEDSDGDGLDREIDDEPGADSEEEIIDQTIDDAIEAGEIEVPDLEEEGDAVGNAVATSGNVTPFARTAAR